MAYEIRSYSEDFIEKQVEIGLEVLKERFGGVQTPLEQIKKSYSAENFDPTTKHYAFYGDEMVGFLTSNLREPDDPRFNPNIVTARLEFPAILSGHEAVEELLLNKAFKVLKEKGVQKVQTRASVDWDNTLDLIYQYGYTEEYTVSFSGKIPLEELNFEEDTSIIFKDFEPEDDEEAWIRLFVDKFGVPEQEIKGQLNFLKTNPKFVLNWKLVKRDNEIVAASIATLARNNPSLAVWFPPIAFENKEAYVRTLFSKHLQATKEREGLTHALIFIPTERIEDESIYRGAGIKLNKLSMYCKMV